MVWTRSVATSSEHPNDGDATNHPNHALDPSPDFVQQQLQSMAATVMKLASQNQKSPQEEALSTLTCKLKRVWTKPRGKEGKKWHYRRRSVKGNHHPRSTTLGERSGLGEDSHKKNEGLYGRKNTHSRPHPQDWLSFHCINHKSSRTLKVQDAYSRLVWWNARSLRSHYYIQVNDASPRHSKRNHMQGLSYNFKGPSEGMAWQVTTKYYNFILEVKQVVHQQLCQKPKGNKNSF